MKILAFESTAKVASVALTDGERLLALYQSDSGRTQSEVLLPMAEHVLATHRMTVDDIDLLTVTEGPGSFTGVRIGVATVKGLAFGRDIPCVGVSTLRSLAENLKEQDGIVCAAMDARRAQVYNAIFRAEGGVITRLTEDRAISVDDLIRELSSYDEPIRLVGDGYAQVEQAAVSVGLPLSPVSALLRDENAYACACVAYRMYLGGSHGSDRELCATYLRLPQAERERLERLKMQED